MIQYNIYIYLFGGMKKASEATLGFIFFKIRAMEVSTERSETIRMGITGMIRNIMHGFQQPST